MRPFALLLTLTSCLPPGPHPAADEPCPTLALLADAPGCVNGVCPRCKGGPSCDADARIFGSCEVDGRTFRLIVDDRTTLFCDEFNGPVAVSMEIPNQDGCPTTRWWGEDLSACDPDLVPIDCDTDNVDVHWVDTADTDPNADTDPASDTDPAVDADTDIGRDTDPVDTDAPDTDPSDSDTSWCADTGCGPRTCDTGHYVCPDTYDSADTGVGGGCAWVCSGWL